MMARIVQHVGERVTHLTRRTQKARMKSICEDLALSLHQAIEAPRYADAQALNSARHVARCFAFDYQVYVIVLHAEVLNRKAVLRAASA